MSPSASPDVRARAAWPCRPRPLDHSRPRQPSYPARRFGRIIYIRATPCHHSAKRWVLSRSANSQPSQRIAARRRLLARTYRQLDRDQRRTLFRLVEARTPVGEIAARLGDTPPPSTASWAGTASATATAAFAATSP